MVALHFATDFSVTLFSGLGHAQTPSAIAWRAALFALAAIIVVLASRDTWLKAPPFRTGADRTCIA